MRTRCAIEDFRGKPATILLQGLRADKWEVLRIDEIIERLHT